MHGVRLASGVWVVNLHAPRAAPPASRRRGPRSLQAAGTALGWAGGAPLVLGGDFNLRARPSCPACATSPATTSTTST